MKVNVTMDDCKFYVQPDKKTVICVLDVDPLLVEDYVTMSLRRIDILVHDSHLADAIEMPQRFVGKAVCAEDDEWNEETGRKLAYMRAKRKFYSSFFLRLNKYLQTIDAELDDLTFSINTMGSNVQRNQEKLIAELAEKL